MAVIEPLLKHIATTGLVTALTVAFVCFVAARFWSFCFPGRKNKNVLHDSTPRAPIPGPLLFGSA